MQAKNLLVLHVLSPSTAVALQHRTVQRYVKRPEDLHEQRKFPQLLFLSYGRNTSMPLYFQSYTLKMSSLVAKYFLACSYLHHCSMAWLALKIKLYF